VRTKRIFWKLYPSYLIITLLSLAAVFFLSSSALHRFYEGQTAESLKVQARFAGEQMREQFGSNQLFRIAEILGNQTLARITVILPDGLVAGDSEKAPAEMGNHANRPEVQEALAGHTGRSVRFSNTLKKNMMYVAVPVSREGRVVGVVRTALPLTDMEQVFQGVQKQIVGGAVLILFPAAAFSLLVSRRISRPLEQVRRGAERFAEGDFSHKLPHLGSTEIGALADTMNDMSVQLEDRLQNVIEERNQREAVLSSMVEGVLAVDTAGHIISLNTAAARFFNVFEPENAPGRSIEEVFRNVKLQHFVADVLEGQETRECELVVENRNTFYLQARGANLLGMQGRRIGAVIVFNDVSRLRRLENLRSEFVANVSHELKTPITSIKGFVETLLDGAFHEEAEAERFLKIVAKQADRLNAIIEDLLMLSRLEQQSGEEMDMQSVEAGRLMQAAVEVCAQRAAEKNITVQTECPEGLFAVVNPPLIEQALINLISNAVKYSAEGKTVLLSAKGGEEGVQLSVKDEGLGIEEKHLDRLFERFYRIDKGRSRQEGGTGLGLAIVKHIAQAHGGAVSVRSEFGKGSTFTVSLPAS